MKRNIRLFFTWLAIMACVAAFFLPNLIHQFDTGKAAVDASRCNCDCGVDTSNVRIRGRILEEYAVEEKTTTRSRGGNTHKSSVYFVPVVGAEWRIGDPICMILMQHKPHSPKEDAGQMSEFPATLQNVLWEGPDDEVVDYLKSKNGLNISEDVLLIKQGSSPGETSTMLWIVFCFFGFASGIPILFLMICKKTSR